MLFISWLMEKIVWLLRFFSYFSVFSELSCFFVFKNQKLDL
ncbi:putative membrane protein [Phocaeicola vulgatus str. 3975 RP4]|uniref:Putative membrane protein n=1 Tax=Phocaeicola vulgatus str. 3975 RP4 TaxID=1339352 RepID=A0A069SHL7_PHOVU|nr:putative membrane protein [Phocaeicola vulgatus str. 3975 RP4]